VPHPQFDRNRLKHHKLQERDDRVFIENDFITPGTESTDLSDADHTLIAETASRIKAARDADSPRIMAFGAHTIKNGLAPLLIHLIEKGWLTHLATNGAGIIHDWEFAFQGHSSEDVGQNIANGTFGLWEETGFFLNLAINVGAYHGLGYGESVGAMVEQEGLQIPSARELNDEIERNVEEGNAEQSAAAADLLQILITFELEPGWCEIKHPFRIYGLQAAAFRLDVPFTGHPMIGHDIIYEHPMNHVASIGRCAEHDFLSFAHAVSQIEDGVYLSIGSAVMSPMIFEKSMAMAQNLAHQKNTAIKNHFMLVVDLHASNWDWAQGEPPEEHPAYYQRFNKTFSRMGGHHRYLCADNQSFLLELVRKLERP
jgi:hypothetical protein